MNCINLKQKLNRTLYCKYKKCNIKISECSSCDYKEYKKSGFEKKSPVLYKKSPVLKNKSSELAKLEKNRFSIFSDNKNKCYLCPATDNLSWHEIYRGRNRANSMRYGLCLRLCISCHKKYQEDKDFNDFWHKKGQALFSEVYPDLDFVDIFKRNYI